MTLFLVRVLTLILTLILGLSSAVRRLSARISARLQVPLSARPRRTPKRLTGDAGQATTEYALVLLAAALVGVLVIGWATAGGGAAAVGRLFDTVIESAIEQL
jgi:hypothetical protein